MNPVIIFEVNDSNSVKSIQVELIKMGYYNAWISNDIRYDLPSNCLWKVNIDLETALQDIKNVIAILNQNRNNNLLILEKCIALSNTPWTGIPNKVIPPQG